MIEFDTFVTDIIQRAPGVKSFRLNAKEGAGFRAGQFFFFTIETGGVYSSKYFSFSNSPTEKGYIEFTKRLTLSPFSHALEKLKIKDAARVKMPLGLFTLDETGRKIAFLSGGIGITPIRSMCKYAIDTNLPMDIILLYGNNTAGDIIFKDDFDNMASFSSNLRVIYTLTAAEADKNWPGKRGYIDAGMIEQEIPDYNKRLFYVCGPPRMVETLVNVLKNDLRIGVGSIKLENFAGY